MIDLTLNIKVLEIRPRDIPPCKKFKLSYYTIIGLLLCLLIFGLSLTFVSIFVIRKNSQSNSNTTDPVSINDINFDYSVNLGTVMIH